MDLIVIGALVVVGLLILFGLFIIFKLFKAGLKLLFGIILNSIAGIACIFLLRLIGVYIPITLPFILPIALFGLPALATILILTYFKLLILS
jgi:hypothetical protein